jgi:hypothetical protein
MQSAKHSSSVHGSSRKTGRKERPVLAVRFRKPSRIVNGVRLIADVQSRSNPSKTHAVLFIDGKFAGRRRRTVACPCKDFHYRKSGRLRSCIHVRRAKQARKAAR